MSRIQEALRKIQNDGKRLARKEDGHDSQVREEDTVTLATLASSDIASGPEESIGTRRIEIDFEALRREGFLAPHDQERVIGRQYREIKRPLVAHAFGKRATRIPDGHIIMLGSALSGEGKTFCALNLALSIAQEKDHSVLLIDADVARPKTSEMLGLKNTAGLLDLIENNEADIESMIVETNIPRLRVLPAGAPRLHATELLASARMELILKHLSSKSKDQLILLDSPPFLQTSEAKVLASLAGQIAMVVKAEETHHESVLAALNSIPPDKVVNLILNQVRAAAAKYHYGYHYGYGYGASGQHANQKSERGENRRRTNDDDIWGGA
jgi:exopolysaccharide/PEP-CTERM locus tyrosine autokinase